MTKNAATYPGTIPEVARDKTFLLRISAEELDSWRVAADEAGLPLAEWIRRRCNGRVIETRVLEVPPAPRARPSKRKAVKS